MLSNQATFLKLFITVQVLLKSTKELEYVAKENQ